jgi:hypothetical protein
MAIMPNIQYRLTGGIDCTNSSNLGILRVNQQLAKFVNCAEVAAARLATGCKEYEKETSLVSQGKA